MNYLHHYLKLIKRALPRTNKPEGYHSHHIIPQCITKNQYTVILSFREHRIAHKLLSKAYPEINGLTYAANMMYGKCPHNGGFFTEETRKKIAKKAAQRKQTPEAKQKLRAHRIAEMWMGIWQRPGYIKNTKPLYLKNAEKDN